ncbi:hypothetical protein A2721_01070 [Candidatus Gottesmanbacteria bacterium RIFCSPHIGHO2_01_FULL_47_48]|uniref:DUF6311 domain-containing protein n=1 Tax=Candidatus Gottesmanbacteria bacterium RIFCSPHIGHO2_01_FULL_47_48 TaxID=1798381 RepID=A0A1F6A613_9BACT|nr:MAG: hypothetical protein A2721_01070 [Candidatus Gottesmanbacteria bacterium RIFCSPHIGHO2_01_FULL_47_48]
MRTIAKHLLVITFFTLVTLIVTWPLIFNPNTLIIDRFDGLLITWILNWNIHSFSSGITGLTNYFQANIFYPFSNTLAFSDYHFLSALIATPFVLVFKEPLIAYNLTLILGFILTAYTTFLLLDFLTKDPKTATLGAILFTFSTLHINYLAHLQLFAFWPVILTLYFLFRKWRFPYIALFVLSSLNSPLNFYFLLLSFTLVLIFQKDQRWATIPTILSAIIVAPFFLPYIQISRISGYVRPINDVIHFSFQIPDLFHISPASRLWSLSPIRDNLTPGYFGLVFFGLAALMLAFNFPHREKIKLQTKFFVFLAGISFILSLGPGLHIFRDTIHVGPLPIIPLPYLALYYLLPGFSGFRTPSRWILLTAFALAMAIGLYFAKRLNGKLITFLIITILVEINFPFSYSRVPSLQDFPPEQAWLVNNYVGEPIIQFPLYNWSDQPEFGLETLREYYSTIHFHPMVNGFSGYSPKPWEERVKWLQKNFPSEESLSYLQNLGIKLVLAPAAWRNMTAWENRLKLVASFPETNIYEML